MRAKKNLPKKETVRLVDDVTKHNMGLITSLRNCKELESAWYFNCSVYGKTFDEKRMQFDIFDNFNNKITKIHYINHLLLIYMYYKGIQRTFIQ